MPDNSYEGLKKRNLSKELDKKLEAFKRDNCVPRLFLHSCCAPCSSYVIEYLSDYFEITVFYYNPNITEAEEYKRRAGEQRRFISEYPALHPVGFLEGEYRPEEYFLSIRGLEDCREGGARCFECYRLRLEATAARAKELGGYDFFTTTLSISPQKDSAKLNEIGCALGEKYNIPYLLSDFKKKEGYKRSVQLSRQYNLYRQNYCGCIFSKNR